MIVVWGRFRLGFLGFLTKICDLILGLWIGISWMNKSIVLIQWISQMEVRLDEKQQHVLGLQKRSKKLEDALINAKKLSSHRQKQLTKLYNCFMEVKEYTGKVKSCEQELQSIVDAVMIESDMGDELVINGDA